jgi:hypothetical protein
LIHAQPERAAWSQRSAPGSDGVRDIATPRQSLAPARALRFICALVLLALTACGGGTATGGGAGGDTGGLSACEAAMQRAAEIDPMQDTVSDLDPAIQQCESLDEFTAAAERFPDALDGGPATTFLSNRCPLEPSLELEAVCREAMHR